jgi:SAM-dependent methyltransferase
VSAEDSVRWRHRLPRRGPVDRFAAIVDTSRGKRVAHIGFVDERQMESKQAEGVWLHAQLDEVASSLVGLDNAEPGVAWARERGYEAHVADAQSPEAIRALGLEPFDVVVAGEVIEHLDEPGPFLRAMLELTGPDGVLVVTTPNAYRLLNFIAPLTGSELVHQDHTAWHSPQTLRTLLERNGWRVEELAYYRTPARRAKPLSNAVRATLATLNRLRPFWSDGLIVWARPR